MTLYSWCPSRWTCHFVLVFYIANLANLEFDRNFGCSSVPSQITANYSLEKCLYNRTKSDKVTWRVTSRDRPGVPLIMQLLRHPNIHLGVLTQCQILCKRLRSLKQLDPEHGVDCIDCGAANEVFGVTFMVQELAPGRSVFQALTSTSEESPLELKKLSSVFDMVLQIYDIMDRGVVEDTIDRYYLIDSHWDNFFITEHGRLTAVDHDMTILCREYGGDLDPYLDQEWIGKCRGALHDEAAKRLVFHLTVITLMSVMSQNTSYWEAINPLECKATHAVWTLPWDVWKIFATWPHQCMNQGPALPIVGSPDLGAAVTATISRIRSAYLEDWSRLDQGPRLIEDVFDAIRSCDPAWPPKLIDHMRVLRDSLH